MGHFEIEAKLFQVRVYGSDNDKYVASFQTYVDGNKAFIYSLNGPGFYENARELLRELMERIGVRTIEAHVMPSHARLLATALKGIAQVEIGAPYRKSPAGRTFCWIQISDPAFQGVCGLSEDLRIEDALQEDRSEDWGEYPPLETFS